MNSGGELTNPFGIDNIIADITKKAMQVEEIWVTPPWDPTTTQHWYLPDQDYEYVNYNEGPVRQSLTIRAPFELRFENPLRSGPGKIFNRYHCYLYRVISLYRGKYFDLGRYHINEEAFCTVDSCETVHSIDERSFKPIGSTNNLNFPLNFRTKYVMYIPHIYTKQIDTFNLIHPLPDWFVIWNNEDPMPGIGFASNSHIKNLKSYGDSIEWEMIPTWHMRNIHLFMDKTNTLVDGKHNFGNVVGSNWFNEIYTPLWAD
jgi:hypothetical protein